MTAPTPLLAAFGVNHVHRLTPARLQKYNALLAAGFTAEIVDGRWRFVRNGHKMPLHHAMMCIEAMAPIPQEAKAV